MRNITPEARLLPTHASRSHGQSEPRYWRRRAAAVAIMAGATVATVRGVPAAVHYVDNQFGGNTVEIPPSDQTDTYRVQPGDTATQISEELYGIGGVNTEPLIDAIHDAAGEDGFQSGEVIEIPDVEQTQELNK